ncbi:carboxypeptidase-like regulatory domain-containing protein [Pedobacter sp. 22226]|uniref:carboxypeptidase-like regulatory domain-containing protein n=1 Tax=Pedobacter sp. 22226 TaxID=3453894 RepID=UPI003F856160
MPSKFKIQISNPCHEDWGRMQAHTNGKFCGSCQKPVVDFTRFSDQELQDWFIKNQGKSCGRFKPEQLDRLIIAKENYTLSKFKPSLIAASLLAFLSFPKLSKGETIKPSMVQTARTITNFDEKFWDEKLSDSLRVIKGKITEKDKTAMPGVSVRILGENYGVITNTAGEFSLSYTIQNEDKFKELNISFLGYENKAVKFKPDDAYLQIVLNESCTTLTGDVVVTRASSWKRILYKVKNQLRDINPFFTKRN